MIKIMVQYPAQILRTTAGEGLTVVHLYFFRLFPMPCVIIIARFEHQNRVVLKSAKASDVNGNRILRVNDIAVHQPKARTGKGNCEL